MKPILLVGANGSMGKRYQAILKYLGREMILTDKDHSLAEVKRYAKVSDGVILATPTETHKSFIHELSELKRPILCEKPITKSVEEFKQIRAKVEADQTPFRMMFQYTMLCPPDRIGRSRYDYFRHGNDGLVWDCMQVVGLARGQVELLESSPIWSCVLNGKALRLSDMDAAYVGYVQNWFRTPGVDLGFLQAVHEKVDLFEKTFGRKGAA